VEVHKEIYIIDEHKNAIVVVMLVAWWDKEVTSTVDNSHLVVLFSNHKHGRRRYLLAEDMDALVNCKQNFFSNCHVKEFLHQHFGFF